MTNRTREQDELLRSTLEFITQNPQLHDQTCWLDLDVDRGVKMQVGDVPPFNPTQPSACGTVGCLAGNAVLLSRRYPMRVARTRHAVAYVEFFFDGEWCDVEDWTQDAAREVLGLTTGQAEALFSSERTLGELWLLAEHITGGVVKARADVVTALDRDVVDELTELYDLTPA
jgi:hypothetical protein